MNAGTTQDYAAAIRRIEQFVAEAAQDVARSTDVGAPAEPQVNTPRPIDVYAKPGCTAANKAAGALSGTAVSAILRGVAALFTVDPKRFATTGFPGIYVPIPAPPVAAAIEAALGKLTRSYDTPAQMAAGALSALMQHLPEGERATYAERLEALSAQVAGMREVALTVPGSSSARALQAARVRLGGVAESAIRAVR